MMKQPLFQRIIFLVLAMCLGTMSSCVPERSKGREIIDSLGDGSECPAGQSCASGSSGGFEGEDGGDQVQVEVRHLVDPFDGTYKTKLTIPKNFTGLLYVSGLNISTLSSSLVFVRFNFGRDKEPITIPGTIGTAPGLTPQTNTQVVILDMEDRPFEDIVLLYDLYDYTEYTASEDVTTDPRDTQLYCRGLNLEDDPTFDGTDAICNDATNEKCFYAYANIRDKGLGNGGIFGIPSEPQVDIEGVGYDNNSSSTKVKWCLHDDGTLNYAGVAGALDLVSVGGTSANPGDPVLTHNSIDYTYNGPYLPIGTSSWQIDPSIAGSVGQYGIFNNTIDGTLATGFASFLFPRAGRLELNSNIQYRGGDGTPNTTAARAIDSLLSPGETLHMDGCNIRATTYDSATAENIASCNVTATIEILAIDFISGQETNLTSENSSVKLQLIKESLTDNEGQEVLFSNFKSCSSSTTCAEDECCFNNRCWSNDLVSTCPEDTGQTANLIVGEACSSDFQCTSFCCDPSTSTCQAHDTNIDPPVTCQKPPGTSCVSQEFCQEETIQECYIVKTGVNPNDGSTTCTLRCYNVLQSGDCVNGQCVAPQAPPVPSFDPDNPDCSSAIDPPYP